MSPPRGKYQIKLNAVMFSMMLEELMEGPSTAQDIAAHTGMAIITVQRTLRVMHRRGVIHVAAWDEDARGAMTLRSFVLGHGKDAKKPPPKSSNFFKKRRDARTAALAICQPANDASEKAGRMTDRIKYVTRRMYSYQGQTMPLGRIARLAGINPGTLYGRVVERGMSVQQALELQRKARPWQQSLKS